MTLRERVLAVLNGEKPDMVPWLGDLDYYFNYLKEISAVPDQYKAQAVDQHISEKGIQQLHKDLGIGFYLQGFFPFKVKYDGIIVKERNEADLRIKEIETPFGSLREVWQYLKESCCWGPKEHLIKSSSDLKALSYLYEHTFYEADYTFAQNRLKGIGDNGVLLCYLPKSPLMELIANLAGIDTVVTCLMDATDEFEETLALMEKKHDEAAQIALDSPAECLMIPENISSEVVGKMLFETYMCGYQRKWVKRIKSAGKFSFVHLDGTMKGLIKELSEVGFDVLEALTPRPVGDIEIEDLHNWVGEKTILWGGIPGGYFTPQYSDEEFDEHVIRVLKVMRSSPRYVLGVADQVVPGSSFERLKRVSELVETYGRYE
jgi:hypothetical protein